MQWSLLARKNLILISGIICAMFIYRIMNASRRNCAPVNACYLNFFRWIMFSSDVERFFSRRIQDFFSWLYSIKIAFLDIHSSHTSYTHHTIHPVYWYSRKTYNIMCTIYIYWSERLSNEYIFTEFLQRIYLSFAILVS